MVRKLQSLGSEKATRHRATLEVGPDACARIADILFGPGSHSRVTAGRLYLETVRRQAEDGPSLTAFIEDEARMAEIGRIAVATLNTTKALFDEDGRVAKEDEK